MVSAITIGQRAVTLFTDSVIFLPRDGNQGLENAIFRPWGRTFSIIDDIYR